MHEIELGDIDDDEVAKILCHSIGPQSIQKSQPGKIVMCTAGMAQLTSEALLTLLARPITKEILVANVDADPEAEIFGVIEALSVLRGHYSAGSNSTIHQRQRQL